MRETPVPDMKVWITGCDAEWTARLGAWFGAERIHCQPPLPPERLAEILPGQPPSVLLVDASLGEAAAPLLRLAAGSGPELQAILMATPGQATQAAALMALGPVRVWPKDECWRPLLIAMLRPPAPDSATPDPRRTAAELLPVILDAIPSPIFYKDRDRRYLGCNRAFERLVGIERQRLVGQTVFDVAPHDDAVEYDRLDRHLMERHDVQEYTSDVRFADGSSHRMRFFKAPFFDAQGRVDGIAGVMLDLPGQKELEKRQALLAAAVHHAAEMIVITDPNGVIQYVNPAFERVTGYTAAEAIGENPRLLKSNHHKPAFYENMWKILLAGGVWSGQMVNRRKNGSTYPEEATISQVHDAEGRLIAYVAVKREMTREVEMQNQLSQAYKMEAIGTLAGGIAHDFNNILTIINGFLQLASARVEPGSRVREYLHQAQTGAERAADMVRQILAFSRQNDDATRPIDICPVAKEIVKFMRGSLPSTIAIDCDLRVPQAVILANATQVHQVMMNLCTNAAQAIGGHQGAIRLTVDTTFLDLERARSVAADPLPPGTYVVVTVSDNGPGIPREIQHRIFDPYFTTKPQGEGTGMGLAVVHGIVTRGGGAVYVESTPGEGASFHVYLPLVEEALETHIRDTTVPKGHGQRILLVDDEPNIASMAAEMLEGIGYRVTTCHDSRQALARFLADPDAFDLVLTDLTMPGLTGIELASQMSAVRPALPLILWTGFAEAIGKEATTDFGFAAVLRKPFDLSSLANGIHDVLRKARRA